MNLSGGALLASSSQTPRCGHTTPMPRKITAAAPGLDFIYRSPVRSAQGGGSTGEGGNYGLQEQRMNSGKYQKGRVLQSLGGGSGDIRSSRVPQERWNEAEGRRKR